LIKLQVGCATLNCKKDFEPFEFRGRNLAEGIPELIVFKAEDGFRALENQPNRLRLLFENQNLINETEMTSKRPLLKLLSSLRSA